MNALRNTVQLIGYTGGEPEVKVFAKGKKLAVITLATNEVFTNEKGEKIKETQWHKLIAWGKQAEVVEQYVAKGKEIAVQGKLTYRTYEDNAGEKHYITEIIIKDLLLLGK